MNGGGGGKRRFVQAKVKVLPPRLSNPAAVIDAVSNSDFEKLFLLRPDDNIPHS